MAKARVRAKNAKSAKPGGKNAPRATAKQRAQFQKATRGLFAKKLIRGGGADVSRRAAIAKAARKAGLRSVTSSATGKSYRVTATGLIQG